MSLSEEFIRYIYPSKKALEKLLDSIEAFLFDMDGPLCNLFGSYPAPEVAHKLKQNLLKMNRLPEEALLEDDPFEVLRCVDRTWPEPNGQALAGFESDLTNLEIDAASEAPPTFFVDQLLPILKENDKLMAIVTNNGTRAAHHVVKVNKWQKFFGNAVFGRNGSDFRQLKPNPKCLLDAMLFLKLEPAQCLMIGDSPTDYQAAQAAGVRFLGLADTFQKAKKLYDAGAEIVIQDYVPLLRLYVDFVEHDFRISTYQEDR